MVSQLTLGDLKVEVVFKAIKNVHLSVYPPHGRVRIAAPLRMKLDTVRVFAIAKLGWIRQQQKKIKAQPREERREYIDRESHYLWGRRYLLKVVEVDAPPAVEIKHSRLVLQVRPGTISARRQEIIDEWYRCQIKEAVPRLLAKWQPVIGASADRFFVQQMKTKWGGCNPAARTLRLNTELAKKPRECLEYIVVHELAHLVEPTHDSRFIALMDRVMPRWQVRRQMLNRLPVRHEEWGY